MRCTYSQTTDHQANSKTYIKWYKQSSQNSRNIYNLDIHRCKSAKE
jgi:hypothetical protein